MKKFDSLGRSLSKNEMKNVFGGVTAPGGCTTTYSGCNNSPEYGQVTCDYRANCNGTIRDFCEVQCNPGDGGACAS